MPSAELRERMGIESVSDAMKWNRLRWLGHVLQKDDMGPGGGKGHERVWVEKGRCEG